MAYQNNEIYNQLSSDLKAMIKNMTGIIKELGWFERTSDLGKFEKDFFDVEDGQSMGTKTYTINGQTVTLEAVRSGVNEKTGAGITKYIATLPDGRKVEMDSTSALTHSNNYGFLNDIIKKTLGGDYEKVNLGINTGDFADQLSQLAEARNIDPKTYEYKMEQPADLQRIDYNTGLPEGQTVAAAASQTAQATYTDRNGNPIDPTKHTNLTPGTTDFNNWLKENNITKQDGQTSQTTANANSEVSLLSQVMADNRVKNDPQMQQWLQGNASLMDRLAQLGYNATDLINEAYAQTRYDRSAFTGDMTVMTAADNRQQTKEAGYDPKTGGPSGGAAATAGFDVPDHIKNSPEYQGMSPDLQAMVDLVYMQMNAQTEERQTLAAEALKAAREAADPYFKVMLDFALDSIPDEFRIKKQTIEEQILTAQERLKEIGLLMDDLSFEEQQTMQQIARNYEQTISNNEEQMAEAGLTYSSKRADLEKYIGEQNRSMVQSTERGYASQMRHYETAQAQQERQEKLIREAGEAQLKSLARGAESTIGTQNYANLGLTGLSGNAITPIGGAQGSIEQQRIDYINSLASVFQNAERPQELTNLLNL